MNGARTADALQRFERDVLARIPLATAMRIRVAEYEPARLALAAPLAPNRNHTGIAFGGAIECLGILACWGVLWLALDDPTARIVIARAETDFRTPLAGELRAESRIPQAQAWKRFTKQFAERGRARIELTAIIGDAKQVEGAHFRGRFVATRAAAS